MITLRFITSIAGNNYSHQRGDEVDWYDDDDALSLIHNGKAKPTTSEGQKAYSEYREKRLARDAAKKAASTKKGKTAKPAPDQVTKPETPAFTVPITELDLDEATLKVLQAAGLETVADVANHGDLTKITGIAKATAAKILKAVSAKN